MKKIKQWYRLIYIAYIWNKYKLSDVLSEIPLLTFFRIMISINPFFFTSKKTRALPRAKRLRLALETLGPIFIKFGQALSTRPDIIAPDLAKELAHLQDNVTPFPENESISIIEKSLKKTIAETFSSFDSKPIASASIAQVHSAKLKNGKDVIIKVLRPNIKKALLKDTDLLTTLAQMIEKYIPSTRRLKPTEVVSEIKRDLIDELDMLREAANASQLKRNFHNSHIHYVPEIYWDYCNHDIIVMERIYGVRATDIEQLKKLNVNLKLLAERGVEIFYTQVFRDCFFHADMHPGNIFINTHPPHDPGYISVDFGIMGTLTREDQRYLAGNFLAFFKRDYKRVAELHIESGWVPTNTRVDELEAAIRTVCEPIFEKPLSEISFGQTLVRLFQVAQRFDMEVQPQLILLQKTLLNIEGMGRQLYPELNLWETAKPFLIKWMKKHIGIKGFAKRVIEHSPKLSEKLPELPDLIMEILENKRYQDRYLKENRKPSTYQESKKIKKQNNGVLVTISLSFLLFSLLYNDTIKSLTPLKTFIEYYSEYFGIAGALIITWITFARSKK
jgi:ubiquinone biosynthesis protein